MMKPISVSNMTATQLLAHAGAVITNSHVVYTSGKHGSAYVNKDRLYLNPEWLDRICTLIADELFDFYPNEYSRVEVVAAPAIGAINLATGVARELQEMNNLAVEAVYAEPIEEMVIQSRGGTECQIRVGEGMYRDLALLDGEKLVLRKDEMEFRRGYDKAVAGKKVLVVEDIINTGGSVRKTIAAVRRSGGEVVGVVAICNRGGVLAEHLDVPFLQSLIDVKMEAFDEDSCPLCERGDPINTEVGKGKDFLAQKRANRRTV